MLPAWCAGARATLRASLCTSKAAWTIRGLGEGARRLRLYRVHRFPCGAHAHHRVVQSASRRRGRPGVNVCFFNRSYWPDQAATGQLLTELAEDLVARHGCEVTVVAGRALHAAADDRRRRAAVERETRHGGTILRANGTRFRPAPFAGRVANYLTYFTSAALAGFDIGRPDIVVSLTDPPIVGVAPPRAARPPRRRFVFLSED